MTDNVSTATGRHVLEAAERPERVPDGQQRVVVGLDGSAGCLRALLFAAREAQMREGVLHLVAGYDISTMATGYAGGLNIIIDNAALGVELRKAAEAHLKQAADTVAALDPRVPVHVRTAVAEGRASQVLLDAADGATPLVVGASGAGAMTRLMLGSTSTEVVHHARLPVTVVPVDDDGSDMS